MLQISTGKYFEQEKRKIHDEKFVFYSNVQAFQNITVSSPKILIEQVESGSLSCFVVSYELITEEHPLIIKMGEQDFIQQFLLIWSFFFDCIAKNDKNIVQKICREKKASSYDQQTAFEISPRTVTLGRKLEIYEISGFIDFVDNLVSTDRNTYKSIIAALKIIDDAKETISTNFDLAYSTIVYAIESLSQKHVGYVPNWADYHEDVKKKIEPILEVIGFEKSNLIKQALIEGKQFKLRKRLEAFVNENLDNSYYHKYLGENTNTMRVSFLSRCLNNLYQLRSSFVHELKPLDVMLSSPHSASSDYVERFGEPYLTYSGLNRMTREIILNFTRKNISNASEHIEWTTETSSTMIVELAAECWIQDPNRFNDNSANKWFSEYIKMLNKKNVVDQSNIMRKIETIFDGAKAPHKKALLHYYWLYNGFHHNEDCQWHTFIKRRENHYGECIQFYVVCLYLRHEFSYPADENVDSVEYLNLDEFDTLYKKYLRERFHKFGLSLCGYTEAALLSAAANLALKLNDEDRFRNYLNHALSEVANKRDTYALIENSMKNTVPVNMKSYFQLTENKT